MSGLSKRIASFAEFLLELVAYAAFVAAYAYIVLHHLGGWLVYVFHSNMALYAILSLALISVQGFLLEILTSALLRVIRRNVR